MRADVVAAAVKRQTCAEIWIDNWNIARSSYMIQGKASLLEPESSMIDSMTRIVDLLGLAYVTHCLRARSAAGRQSSGLAL